MLYLFDVDGTLIRSYLGEEKPRHYADIEPLPGRKEKLRELHDAGHRLGICTNQGGVAFGHVTEDDVRTKMMWVRAMLFPVVRIAYECCYTHPAATIDMYRSDSDRRKPGPGMLLDAMTTMGVPCKSTVYVGDMDTDREAALAAGVGFDWAKDFFGD